MPELPEVETTRRGIEPHINQQIIDECIIRFPTLRWPIPTEIIDRLPGQKIQRVSRRSKYVLIETQQGTLLIHLGMSGSLRVLQKDTAVEKHDHFDLVLENGKCLRLNDPRRFGAILWHPIEAGEISEHALIKKLAPEPLSDAFNAEFFYNAIKKRSVPIKTAVMNSEIVVGAGNIYANESLFLSGLHPSKRANSLTKKQATLLCENIKSVLAKAITQGGTTLKDFIQPDGKPGYFKQSLHVYGREGEACTKCGHPIEKMVIAQRASFYCPICQKK